MNIIEIVKNAPDNVTHWTHETQAYGQHTSNAVSLWDLKGNYYDESVKLPTFTAKESKVSQCLVVMAHITHVDKKVRYTCRLNKTHHVFDTDTANCHWHRDMIVFLDSIGLKFTKIGYSHSLLESDQHSTIYQFDVEYYCNLVDPIGDHTQTDIRYYNKNPYKSFVHIFESNNDGSITFICDYRRKKVTKEEFFKLYPPTEYVSCLGADILALESLSSCFNKMQSLSEVHSVYSGEGRLIAKHGDDLETTLLFGEGLELYKAVLNESLEPCKTSELICWHRQQDKMPVNGGCIEMLDHSEPTSIPVLMRTKMKELIHGAVYFNHAQDSWFFPERGDWLEEHEEGDWTPVCGDKKVNEHRYEMLHDKHAFMLDFDEPETNSVDFKVVQCNDSLGLLGVVGMYDELITLAMIKDSQI